MCTIQYQSSNRRHHCIDFTYPRNTTINFPSLKPWHWHICLCYAELIMLASCASCHVTCVCVCMCVCVLPTHLGVPAPSSHWCMSQLYICFCRICNVRIAEHIAWDEVPYAV